MKKQGKSFKGRKGREPTEMRTKVPINPPQLMDQLHVSQTLRFITTGIGASSSTTVTFQNLLDSWLIAGTATAGYQLFDFVRVRRVTIRAIPYISGSSVEAMSVTVGIEFPGLVAGSNAGGKQASDTGLGVNRPAMVSLVPDRLSAASFFQPSSGNVAMVLRATNFDNSICVGACIDVECDFKNSADVNPAAVASAIAGATAGTILFGGVDGARLAATWARSAFVPRI